jgi:hypothetical protein
MIFVGYEAGSMAYCTYDPSTKRIHITRDVVFDEEANWNWDHDKIDNEFIIDYVAADHPEVVLMRHGGHAASPVPGAGAASPDSAPRSASPAGGQASPRLAVTLASPPAGAEMGLDADHNDEAPLWFRTL